MRPLWLVILALLAATVPAAAQVGGADQNRRAELERQFRRQFMMQVAQRLDLTADQREEMRQVLSARAEERRDLALESQALRIELIQAVRDEDAAMSRFEDILSRLEALRSKEREIESAEEADLAEILDPRQRAIFLMLRMQLNDRIRQMRGPGPGAEGPPGTGGPFL